jgi:hypothetical protein
MGTIVRPRSRHTSSRTISESMPNNWLPTLAGSFNLTLRL